MRSFTALLQQFQPCFLWAPGTFAVPPAFYVPLYSTLLFFLYVKSPALRITFMVSETTFQVMAVVLLDLLTSNLCYHTLWNVISAILTCPLATVAAFFVFINVLLVLMLIVHACYFFLFMNVSQAPQIECALDAWLYLLVSWKLLQHKHRCPNNQGVYSWMSYPISEHIGWAYLKTRSVLLTLTCCSNYSWVLFIVMREAWIMIM